MNDNNTSDEQEPSRDNSNSYFDNLELDKSKVITEIPAEQQPVYDEKLPSGFDPMGRIYLSGRAYRGISGGRISWLMLISAWVVFGAMFVTLLSAAFTSPGFAILFALLVSSLPLIITLRGTLTKLSSKERRR